MSEVNREIATDWQLFRGSWGKVKKANLCGRAEVTDKIDGKTRKIESSSVKRRRRRRVKLNRSML